MTTKSTAADIVRFMDNKTEGDRHRLMNEWKLLSEEDKEWFKQELDNYCASIGVDPKTIGK